MPRKAPQKVTQRAAASKETQRAAASKVGTPREMHERAVQLLQDGRVIGPDELVELAAMRDEAAAYEAAHHRLAAHGSYVPYPAIGDPAFVKKLMAKREFGEHAMTHDDDKGERGKAKTAGAEAAEGSCRACPSSAKWGQRSATRRSSRNSAAAAAAHSRRGGGWMWPHRRQRDRNGASSSDAPLAAAGRGAAFFFRPII